MKVYLMKMKMTTILPIPTVEKLVIPKAVEPGRVLMPVELVNILYPMPTFEVSGYSFVMGSKVFTKEAACDNIEPIKYKDIFEVPLTFEKAWNHPCPLVCSDFVGIRENAPHVCIEKGQTKHHSPWAQMH
jgi:hypothetical protein